MDYLNQQQIDWLLKPIDPRRVSQFRSFSYLQPHDVKRQLTRIFGFGRWSSEAFELAPTFEDLSHEGRVSVGYRVGVRLTVKAPDGTPLAVYSEYAFGDAKNQPIINRGDAHDLAIKSAESQALKRCAVALGDQFGLGLYNNGSTDAFVMSSLVGVEDVNVDEVEQNSAPVLPEEGSWETQEDGTESASDTTVVSTTRPAPTELQGGAQARLESYDALEELKVDIQSEHPDVRNRLRVLWQLNGLPKIDQLTDDGIAKVRELLGDAKSAEVQEVDNHVPMAFDDAGDPAAQRAFYGTMDKARGQNG